MKKKRGLRVAKAWAMRFGNASEAFNNFATEAMPSYMVHDYYYELRLPLRCFSAAVSDMRCLMVSWCIC